jgi:hypothetical protein
LTNATVLFADPPGFDAGAVYFAGEYYVGDNTGWLLVYQEKGIPQASAAAPGVGLTTDVSGTFEYFPSDGGDLGQPQLSGKDLTMTLGGAGTLPTAQTVTLDQLDYSTGDSSLIGQYVEVPAGTYKEDSTSPVWTYTSSATPPKTYYDGIILTSGSTTIAVDTTTFSYPTKPCHVDAGANTTDLTKGGFTGVFDTEQTDDGAFHKVIVFGSCPN